MLPGIRTSAPIVARMGFDLIEGHRSRAMDYGAPAEIAGRTCGGTVRPMGRTAISSETNIGPTVCLRPAFIDACEDAAFDQFD